MFFGHFGSIIAQKRHMKLSFEHFFNWSLVYISTLLKL
jgi:hypothetical protein